MRVMYNTCDEVIHMSCLASRPHSEAHCCRKHAWCNLT